MFGLIRHPQPRYKWPFSRHWHSFSHMSIVLLLCFCFVILILRRRHLHAVAADCVPSSFFDLSLQLLCLFCVYSLFYTLQMCVQESIAALWAQRSRALLQYKPHCNTFDKLTQTPDGKSLRDQVFERRKTLSIVNISAFRFTNWAFCFLSTSNSVLRAA